MKPLSLNPDDLLVQSFEPLARVAPPAPGVYETDEERRSLCFRSCDTECEPVQ